MTMAGIMTTAMVANVAMTIAVTTQASTTETVASNGLGSQPSSAPSNCCPSVIIPSTSPTSAPSSSQSTSPASQGNISSSVADPHIESFDGLSWDCQATGEFILSQSLDSNFEIQGRFTPIGRHGSITTAIVIREQGNPTVQVSLASISSNDACPSEFYIAGVEQQVGDRFSWGEISIRQTSEQIDITYKSTGLEVTLFRRQSASFGCFFSTSIFLPAGYRQQERIVGLYGTPNGDPTDDWMSPDGTRIELPTESSDLVFEAAYNYCSTHWCIRDEADSLFTYKQSGASENIGEGFANFFDCDAAYDPDIEEAVANAPSELTAICGTNLGCLIEGVVGDVQDAQEMLNDQAMIQEMRDARRAYITPVTVRESPKGDSNQREKIALIMGFIAIGLALGATLTLTVDSARELLFGKYKPVSQTDRWRTSSQEVIHSPHYEGCHEQTLDEQLNRGRPSYC